LRNIRLASGPKSKGAIAPGAGSPLHFLMTPFKPFVGLFSFSLGPLHYLRSISEIFIKQKAFPPTLTLPEGVKKLIFSRHPGENRGPVSS
jgi:hypothetical protein